MAEIEMVMVLNLIKWASVILFLGIIVFEILIVTISKNYKIPLCIVKFMEYLGIEMKEVNEKKFVKKTRKVTKKGEKDDKTRAKSKR